MRKSVLLAFLALTSQTALMRTAEPAPRQNGNPDIKTSLEAFRQTMLFYASSRIRPALIGYFETTGHPMPPELLEKIKKALELPAGNDLQALSFKRVYQEIMQALAQKALQFEDPVSIEHAIRHWVNVVVLELSRTTIHFIVEQARKNQALLSGKTQRPVSKALSEEDQLTVKLLKNILEIDRKLQEAPTRTLTPEDQAWMEELVAEIIAHLIAKKPGQQKTNLERVIEAGALEEQWSTNPVVLHEKKEEKHKKKEHKKHKHEKEHHQEKQHKKKHKKHR